MCSKDDILHVPSLLAWFIAMWLWHFIFLIQISDPVSVQRFVTSTTTVEQLRDFLEIPDVYIWQMLAIDADKVVCLLGITFKEGRTQRLVVWLSYEGWNKEEKKGLRVIVVYMLCTQHLRWRMLEIICEVLDHTTFSGITGSKWKGNSEDEKEREMKFKTDKPIEENGKERGWKSSLVK